jgi:hypothetical protein
MPTVYWFTHPNDWAVDAPHLIALVRVGAIFHKGKLLERPTYIPARTHHRGAVRRIGGRLTHLARY